MRDPGVDRAQRVVIELFQALEGFRGVSRETKKEKCPGDAPRGGTTTRRMEEELAIYWNVMTPLARRLRAYTAT